jgi:hypothetical protein
VYISVNFCHLSHSRRVYKSALQHIRAWQVEVSKSGLCGYAAMSGALATTYAYSKDDGCGWTVDSSSNSTHPLFLQAPAEVEAELARLNRFGLVDAVLSDDVDMFLFGAFTVIRK